MLFEEEKEFPKTLEDIKSCIRHNPRFIFDVDFSEFSMTNDDYMECIHSAIERKPRLILELLEPDVISNKMFREELLYCSIEKDVDIFTDIPDSCKTYEICLLALEQDISYVEYVPPILIDKKISLMILNSKQRKYYNLIPKRYKFKQLQSKSKKRKAQ